MGMATKSANMKMMSRLQAYSMCYQMLLHDSL